jgi:hypothetical protein
MDINDITYKINGAIFEVNKILGPGFLEKVYENALLLELKNRGLEADKQVPIKVIIELKTVVNLDNNHEAQLLNYLKATGIKVGILVNFKQTRAEIKRMVLNLPEHSI